MDKIDFKKLQKELYAPSAREVSTVTVPPMNFFMVDGKGSPDSTDFQQAMEVLYPMSYTLKFMLKNDDRFAEHPDYVVQPMEGLWWAEDFNVFREGKKDEWQWTVMIRQPDFVNDAIVAEARELVRKKKNPAALDTMRFENFEEGLSVQIMHIGPYSEEAATIARLMDFIEEHNYEINGHHHEIYLGDPRKTAPEKLRTTLRYPVRPR